MKTLLLIFLLFATFSLSAQVQWNEGEYIIYKEVAEMNRKKEDLKKNANKWLVKNFKNTNSGVKMNDDENIIAKDNFKGVFRDGLGSKRGGTFNYTLQIEFKEDKYRLVLDSFTVTPNEPGLQYMAEYGMIHPMENPEQFKAVYSVLIENTLSGLTKRSALKSLEKPKRVLKLMKSHKKAFAVIQPQLVSHCEDLASSLLASMKKENEDDW